MESCHTASRTMMGVESSRLHGFDFACQGVLSIWEGFPSFPGKNLPAEDKERGTLHSDQGTHPSLGATGRTSSGRGHRRPSSRNKSAGDSSRLHYESAIETINGGRTHGVKKDMPSATVQSSKVARRLFALGLFGWDYSDAEFRQAIQRSAIFLDAALGDMDIHAYCLLDGKRTLTRSAPLAGQSFWEIMNSLSKSFYVVEVCGTTFI
jgi:hypothetical protein